MSKSGSYITHNNNNDEWPIKPQSPWSINLKSSLNEVWKSSDADPCHLVRVHSDVPGAVLAIVVVIGVVPAGKGA